MHAVNNAAFWSIGVMPRLVSRIFSEKILTSHIVSRSKEDASLEMKPLRIPPDDKWLESYTSLLCNGGKPPPSAGPYHPAVLMAHLKGHQHMFIKGWPLLDEPK